MVNCCKVRERYERINDEMAAPSRVSRLCGHTYLWMREKNRFITQATVLALGAISAGITAMMYFNPHSDPIEDGSVIFKSAFSAVCFLEVISSVFELLYLIKYPQEKRRLPSPFLLAALSVVSVAVVSFLQLKEAERIAANHNSSMSESSRVEEVIREISVPEWIIASCVSSAVAGVYEGVIHRFCNPRRAGRDSEVLMIT